jgi:ADP-ribose pyrophosphatase
MRMRETLLTGRVFAVERRRYPQPDGHALVREIVVHPGAVAILPVRVDGSIVMIHNFRHAVEQELLELPAGTLQPGEAPVDCAARELEEETGFRADTLDPLCEFYTTPGITDERMHVFVARGLTPTAQKLERGEQIRVEVMPDARVREMLRAGRIRDGKTIAALGIYYSRQQG